MDTVMTVEELNETLNEFSKPETLKMMEEHFTAEEVESLKKLMYQLNDLFSE